MKPKIKENEEELAGISSIHLVLPLKQHVGVADDRMIGSLSSLRILQTA
jgi:hypothetical protein